MINFLASTLKWEYSFFCSFRCKLKHRTRASGAQQKNSRDRVFLKMAFLQFPYLDIWIQKFYLDHKLFRSALLLKAYSFHTQPISLKISQSRTNILHHQNLLYIFAPFSPPMCFRMTALAFLWSQQPCRPSKVLPPQRLSSISPFP